MSDAEGTPNSSTEDHCPVQTPSPSSRIDIPANKHTPRCDNDDTPTSQDFTSSPNKVDDTAEESFQNPEPPKELVGLLNADNIGGTVFSKHWLFTTLMRLLQVVDNEDDSSSAEGTESPAGTQCIDIDDALQDNLCKLWDMSMNPEVVSFLMEFKAVELLSGVIAKSRAPRATEICVGILGNMACNSDACRQISNNKQLVELILLLLETPDAPTLVETTRLLHVCLSSSAADSWLLVVKQMPHVFPSVLFILQSSTNQTLLRNAAEFVDKLMEIDEDLCTSWSCPELVLAIMEAIKQIGYNDVNVLETFIHLLQLISTSQQGVQALVSYAGEVCSLTMRHLVHVCVDDIVVIEGRENVIGATLSVLSVVFPSWQEHTSLLVTDFQLMRCIAKITEAVYPKLDCHPVVPLTPRHRTQSMSESCRSPSPATHGEHSNDINEIDEISDNIKETGSKPESVDSQPSCKLISFDDPCEDSAESADDDPRSDDASSQTHIPESRNKQTDSSTRSDSCLTMTKLLFEILQTLLADILTILDEIPVCEALNGLANGENEEHRVDSAEEEDRTPKSLMYLDRLCDRRRVECIIHTLAAVSEKSLVSRLRDIGRRHSLSRLCRIIDDIEAFSVAAIH